MTIRSRNNGGRKWRSLRDRLYDSKDFPTKTPFQQLTDGHTHVFVTKLNLSGAGANDLVYSTNIGGTQYEEANGIALDAAGVAYVTGYTSSADFPFTGGRLSMGNDAALCFFNGTGRLIPFYYTSDKEWIGAYGDDTKHPLEAYRASDGLLDLTRDKSQGAVAQLPDTWNSPNA